MIPYALLKLCAMNVKNTDVLFRFSALSKPEDDSRGRFGTRPARGDSRGRGSGGFGRPQSRGITPRSSMEQEKERALAAVRYDAILASLFTEV